MIEIRQAKPEDLNQAVDLIYSAAPEAFEYMFTRGEKSAKGFIAHCFAQGDGFMGYKTHHVAVLNGQVVGTISIYNKGAHQRLGKETERLVVQYYGFWRMLLMAPRLMRSKRWMVSLNEKMDYVANLGVSPKCRSQGVGAQLLRFGYEQAKSKGYNQYALDVADTNPRAEALYQRFGFQFVSEHAYPKAEKAVPKARRLIMPVR